MSNWTSINVDDLKGAGHGAIVDRAQTLATGAVDPVCYTIDAAVARVRRAVSAYNSLDTDPKKVPFSLEALTVRLALYALMERIGLALNDDQRQTRKADLHDLDQIADRKIRVEEPDNIDPAAVPQDRGNWNSEPKIIGRTHPVPQPGVQYPPDDAYANPDAPQDPT